MNWKNVLRLISVDTKAGRLIRGQRLRRYRERKFFLYLLYGGACILGLAIGIGAGSFYAGLADSDLRTLFYQGARSLFFSFPTVVLIYSLIFTMMSQIQRAGVRASIQLPYWLPITWQEHTLASILANLVGVPLVSLVLFGSAIASVSVFLGETSLATLTLFALIASAFLASTTTEIFRVLQTRLIGAVYKSSGKAAVWVRFLGTLLFFIAFYVVWFAFSSGTGSVALIEAVAETQQVVWFIPYVWLGMILATFAGGLLAQTVIFSLASLLFIIVLFYVAVRLNTRFGLYEPPAITISRGVYTPKTGFLGRLGFSSLEAAVIRKDFRAFTRRRELMYIFIMPIVFILMPLLQFSGFMAYAPEGSRFLLAWLLLVPGAMMAVTLGTMIIGEEGESVWLFFSSPITARSLVKCKYAFVIILSCVVTLVCGAIGIFVARPSPDIAIALSIESVLLILALGVVSIRAGIKGADFSEVPRPRIIRPLTALANVVLCLVLALVIFSPLLLYAFTMEWYVLHIPVPLPKIDAYVAVFISAVIGLAVTLVFYKIALKNAKEFLIRAEI